MARQHTIAKPVSIEGLGLFTGQPCTQTFCPASADAGIEFVRTDLAPAVTIPVNIAHVDAKSHRTGLAVEGASVETVEHVLSAVSGLGIDNLRIELTAGEPPSTDGSPKCFVDALASAGIVELDADVKPFIINEPVAISDGDAMITALPGPLDSLEILYNLDYTDMPSVGKQVGRFILGKDNYEADLAPARTFALMQEAQAMQAAGMCTHLTPQDILVMAPEGPIGNTLRFDDEHVRHKIADLIGDLTLMGRPIYGRVIAHRSGHDMNQKLVAALTDALAHRRPEPAKASGPMMDIRAVMRLLPHRYPFLMVDRIVEMDGDREITGIKNVTINEPFFQGHYPGQPIMPGVLIIEALAQISGILLSRRLEHTGKVAVLLSLDRVKMRRPVRPGDQLILKAEALHIRPRTGHCKCQALVDGQTAAEAEVKFMLVDADAT
jgi:UDP-3-O-[3-hydroxymyristoyl] N-acetylglucosamine deacetylase/3-hydroxyacyl-[acyl-carrier-protein] dehydratase